MRLAEPYLSRSTRYPANVTDGERELIDAIDAAIRGVQSGTGPGPYGALEHIAAAVRHLIDERESDAE